VQAGDSGQARWLLRAATADAAHRRTTSGRRAARAARTVALLLLLALVASCATSVSKVSRDVTLVGSWSGEELVAFRSVLDLFEHRTGHKVTYVETRDLRGTIESRLRDGAALDVAGVTGPAHLAELAGTGVLRPLSAAIDVGAYKSDVAPTFIELGSIDGRLVGAFIKSTAKGLVWYDPGVFRLGVPTDWQDLQRMAVAAAGPRTHPWCVGLSSRESSGWPGTDWVENIVIRQSGADVYDRWVSGHLPWTSREVRRAFELFGQVVAEDAVHGGSSGATTTDFSRAGAPLFTRPPGCLFMQQGSFMLPFLATDGRIPGRDVDFFPFPALDPDHEGVLVGAGDIVALLSDEHGARELIAFLVSAEGQAAWVATGAALSINAHVTDYPNDVARRAAGLLVAADQFRFDASDEMPARMSDAFTSGVLEFVADQRRLPDILEGLDAVRRDAYAR
jgi:alpha-glucoside transport system substrate-binding protein